MSEGLHQKYQVRRLDDEAGRHNFCRMFVLDIHHDPYARDALYAYAIAVRHADPRLTEDLLDLLHSYPLEDSSAPRCPSVHVTHGQCCLPAGKLHNVHWPADGSNNSWIDS